jgi:MOSC domain-containing protein YiiM
MALEQNKIGRVASLRVHPSIAGEPLIAVNEFNLVAEKGIREDSRYFGRTNRAGGPAKRQVSLIEREMIDTHAAALGVELPAGDVRSNIETTGIDLVALVGCEVRIGEAVLSFIEPRTPCKKMDQLAMGLRELMENGRQGVIAMVTQSGRIRPGDSITVVSSKQSPQQ